MSGESDGGVLGSVVVVWRRDHIGYTKDHETTQRICYTKINNIA